MTGLRSAATALANRPSRCAKDDEKAGDPAARAAAANLPRSPPLSRVNARALQSTVHHFVKPSACGRASLTI